MMKNAFPTMMIVLMACGGASTATSPESTTPSSAEASPQAADAPAAGSSACEELATTCHGHDEGNALVGECHMVGHNADAAACSARYDECMAACRQAAEGHAHSE